MTSSNPQSSPAYELRFQHLVNPERCFAFPCDAQGRVDMDALSERALNSYLFARALMGRDTSTPVVCQC
ncbi:hypothetical protein [Azohydromonas aeria]|uniref:hypothetical protein n=1 Tax=Azohydromonas aeria TaxID=2590212 RepID=UPI0012FC3100|nr:hypothetical protein [Azohydromonas aeria]